MPRPWRHEAKPPDMLLGAASSIRLLRLRTIHLEEYKLHNLTHILLDPLTMRISQRITGSLKERGMLIADLMPLEWTVVVGPITLSPHRSINRSPIRMIAVIDRC